MICVLLFVHDKPSNKPQGALSGKPINTWKNQGKSQAPQNVETVAYFNQTICVNSKLPFTLILLIFSNKMQSTAEEPIHQSPDMTSSEGEEVCNFPPHNL